MQIERFGRCWRAVAHGDALRVEEGAESVARVAGPRPSSTWASIELHHNILVTMNGDDDDLKLQRASSALLADLEKLLPKLVRGRQQGSTAASVRQFVREADMYRACALVRSMSLFDVIDVDSGLD